MAESTATPPRAPRLLFPLQWAVQKRTPLHWFQGAAAHARWQDGVSLISEADFDAAIALVQELPITAVPPSER